MVDVEFRVSPAGLFGMSKLAKFLNTMKGAGAIADWHPKRAITESKGRCYVVQFADERDAAHATLEWTSTEQGAHGAA